MRKLFLPLLLTSLTLAAQPFEPRGGGRRGGPELLPPPGWWHDPYLSENLKLTNEQMQKLDKLRDEDHDGVQKLEGDIRKAEDELRAALNDRNANVERIIAAGNKVAALKDQNLRRQVVMLANQRAVLTHAQWTALQKQLDERRGPPPMGGERGGRRPPGMRPPR